ncbi:MAG: hypothetical protein WC748_10515 [Legionellales bacterium]|jgi:hypothetical protein
MSRNHAQKNIETLAFVANRLEELCDEVVFVGGCVTGLLVTDKASPDVRFTVDVDCIVNVVTKSSYYNLSEKLRQKGFKEIPFGDHPICRWNCEGIFVDIMPIDENVLGFSNRWYKDALENSLIKKINDSIQIKFISAPYFLATKFEAFKDRGEQDFLSSHDLEDIVFIIDARAEIVEDVSNALENVKEYLSSELYSLVSNDLFLQALPGHLNYSEEYKIRQDMVLNRMQMMIDQSQ